MEDVRRQGRGQLAHFGDRHGVPVDGADVEAVLQQIDEIAAAAAAGVQYPHAANDAAAQELVEQVDVDCAELILQC